MKSLFASAVAIVALVTCVSGPAASDADESEQGNPVGDLLTAAKTGDVKAIERLLASGTNVDAKDQGRVTALFVASLFGQSDAAKLLIDKGADIGAAKGGDGSTALHAAAFFCHTKTVRLLLKGGAKVNARSPRNETPLDTVSAPWSAELGGVYTGIGNAIGLEVDLKRVEAARPEIAALLRKRGGKTAQEVESGGLGRIAARGLRSSYYVNGEIHVNVLGTPEGKPLTSGHADFKPSWSKTGDMLVFFRRLKNDRVVTNWKTAICVINVDGTGFQQLTDGTHTDFNQTWTRDGRNTPIWNRKNPKKGSFVVMQSKVGNRPGQEVAISDREHHTWAYTCLMDGRILVQCAHPKQGWGYFLMTPKVGGDSRFERIDCELATRGLLDRVSLSPSETRVCFEYQKGFRYKDAGRTLYIADFDAKKRTITNAKPFANEEGKPVWFAYPRWTKGEAAVVYHAGGKLYLYTIEDGSTARVSTNGRADYRYPHGEAMPK